MSFILVPPMYTVLGEVGALIGIHVPMCPKRHSPVLLAWGRSIATCVFIAAHNLVGWVASNVKFALSPDKHGPAWSQLAISGVDRTFFEYKQY